VERYADPADRRRTIVEIIPAQRALVHEWLDGAAGPLARVLDKLAPSEQAAFLKAMDLLETELRARTTSRKPVVLGGTSAGLDLDPGVAARTGRD